MLFTDPGCGPCNAMLPEVGRWQEEHAQKLTLALVSRGEVEENKTKAQEHGLKNVLLQKDWEVSESYEVRGTPSAVLISPDGKVASPVAGGEEGIRGLLSVRGGRTRPASDAAPPTPNRRAAVPQLRQGPRRRSHRSRRPKGRRGGPRGEASRPRRQHRGASRLQGRRDPGALLEPGVRLLPADAPRPKEWEQNPPEDAPKLLVVSAGTEEANREMGLTSTVLLDQNFAVGTGLRGYGTPSAVLVDAEGKVASEVAVGAPAVLELAGASRTGP